MLKRILILSSICCVSFAAELENGLPEDHGLSSERLTRVTELAERYVNEGRVPGVHVMASRNGEIVLNEVVGNRGLEDDRPLKEDDIYRIYSMTKPVTAVAAMQLFEQGKFRLNDPIAKYIPELKDLKVLVDGELVDANQPITMHHILTHTAGFSYGFDLRDPVDQQYRAARLWSAKDLDDFAARLAKLPLKFQPGEQWHYSVAVDVTGLAIERISGMPFDEYLQKNLFDPLDMVDTHFEVPKDKRDRLLPSHIFDYKTRQIKVLENAIDILGEMEPGDAMFDYENVSLYSGGGGLVSTTRDYMRFAEMLRAGGSLGDAQILSPKTINFMTKNHLPTTIYASGTGEDIVRSGFRGFGFGLGFGVILDSVATKSVATEGTFMWGGAAATIFWVDPVENMVVLGMMQLLTSPYPFREELRNASSQAITESYE